jgi:hypothetical protein
MPLDPARARQYLREFSFQKLFTQELGWDHYSAHLDVQVDGTLFPLTAISEKRGFQVFVCEAQPGQFIPDYGMRRKVDRQVTKSAHEHLIIFTDTDRTTQVWQWVKREAGKPSQSREHTYHTGQPGDALIQKLQSLIVAFEEEETLTLFDVTLRTKAGFDVEKVTKRFYDRFKAEHAAFLRFLKGIPDENVQRWYVSVMLNRLMFIYFIQKKSFLAADMNYLRTKLAQSKQRGKDLFYREFLCPLFFEGFAKKEVERSPATNELLGKVPYLNGGLFLRHQIEEQYGKEIRIADPAFEKIFSFFEEYRWHLDERPLRADNEINPDVLGYIFEKYINQKQMGAYYTKEDITGYISQNTVIPFLFDAAQKKCKIAFEGEHSVWRLLEADPNRYIYPAVKKGVELPLPDEIAAGLNDALKRGGWNKPAPEEYALPTEIWREVVARRKRYEEVKGKLTAGEIRTINDLITYNLDIRQFAQDVIENCQGAELPRAFYHAIEKVTVLDPACGSGAFLFAALNILEPLYEACLNRMESLLEDLERSGEKYRPEKFSDFRKILDRVAQHPNRRYFILKSIILNNLYGVDIMEEATEICKLRLFLKLVAQIDSVEKIEPLPDIDFNIRAGNTLVGYATYDDVKRAVSGKLDFEGKMAQIEEKAQEVEELFAQFRLQQTEIGGEVTADDKAELRRRLKVLEDELNEYLAGEYGVKVNDKTAYSSWLVSHKPFHWFIEFYRILKSRGFDAVIGNPPYFELKDFKDYQLRDFACVDCGNVYAVVLERSALLGSQAGFQGFIVPVSSVSTDRYSTLQNLLAERELHYSSYDDRPSRLFDGLEHSRLTVHIMGKPAHDSPRFSTRYNKWLAAEREHLFSGLGYASAKTTLVPNTLPKLSSCIEFGVLQKLGQEKRSLAYYYAPENNHCIFYSRKVGYFLQVLDFEPTVLDARRRRRPPSEFKQLNFRTDAQASVALCCLNSNLFYWFVTVFSDCRHVNKREVDAFPIRLEELAGNELGNDLRRLARDLMQNLKRDSRSNVMRFSHDTLTVQCIYPKLSKPVIDAIDEVLAKHYGFSDEELDFIINYDIKYRMGREAAEEE